MRDKIMKINTLLLIFLLLNLTLCGSSFVVHSSNNSSDLKWLKATQVFTTEPTLLKLGNGIEIRQVPGTVVSLGGFTETPEQKAWVSRIVNKVHRAGLKYEGTISGFNAFWKTLKNNPHLKKKLQQAACINIEGNPTLVPWESEMWSYPSYWESINHPIWQHFLKKEMKWMVDAGVDAIRIDEEQGSAFANIAAKGCFDEYTLEGFRKYLKREYSSKELKKKYQINDINTFKYDEYIKKRGYKSKFINHPRSVPLFNVFYKFQLLSAKKFWEEAINETRNYARKKYQKEIAFTANLFGLNPTHLFFSDLFDYYYAETPYLQKRSGYGYPPDGKSIPLFKLGWALSGYPTIASTSLKTRALLAKRDRPNLLKLYIAEAYSGQGSLVVPWEGKAWEPNIGSIHYDPDLQELYPYYEFILDHDYLYEKIHSNANIALVYSYPSARHNYNFVKNFFGISDALLDDHYQFDVIIAESKDLQRAKHSLSEIGKYEVAILPDVQCLSNNQVEMIWRYIDNGGIVISWGDIGIKDGNCKRTTIDGKRKLLHSWSENPRQIGKGVYHHLLFDLGKEYQEKRSDWVLKQLRSVIGEEVSPLALVESSSKVNVLTYIRKEKSKLIAHLLNYDYSKKTDQFHSKGNFIIKLRKPESFKAKKWQANLFSPDLEQDFTVPLEEKNNYFVIKVPKLVIYDIITVTTTS